MTNLAIGIEGGGTKTRVVVVDCDSSKILYNKLHDIPVNPYLSSVDAVLVKLDSMIAEAIAELKVEQPHFLGISASGFNTKNEQIDKHYAGYKKFVQSHDTAGPLAAFKA